MNALHATLIIALLALGVLLLIWQGVLLGRIVRRLDSSSPRRTAPSTPSVTPGTEAGGEQEPAVPSTPETDFDRFLMEDPQRQLLAKKEQAAAYREWRKQHGLTWNAGR